MWIAFITEKPTTTAHSQGVAQKNALRHAKPGTTVLAGHEQA